jgi:hypothetical protein
MPTIRVELDTESFRRLTELAVEERRPIPWQAEILLLRALAAPVEGGVPSVNTCAKQEVPCAAE